MITLPILPTQICMWKTLRLLTPLESVIPITWKKKVTSFSCFRSLYKNAFYYYWCLCIYFWKTSALKYSLLSYLELLWLRRTLTYLFRSEIFFFRIAHMRILDKLKFVSLSVIKRQKLPSFSVMAYCCLFFLHMNIKFQNLIEEK